MAKLLAERGVPLLIHQPSYNMFNRWIEGGLIEACDEVGAGIIVFTALAQGLLTDRYLDGVPADSRAAREDSTIAGLDAGVLDRVRALDKIASDRGQKLAQLALLWVLRDRRVTSAVIGASSVEQLDTNLDALDGPPLTAEELARIDEHAVASGVDLWATSSRD
jgi:L-glyceraldehyde 3-phosphate reductase